MEIKIVERLKPFTHEFGQLIPVPKTLFAVRIYPEKVQIFSLSETSPKLVDEVFFSIIGPVEGFTATLDLERERVVVNGKETRGYFQYEIEAGLPIRLKRFPDGFALSREFIIPSTEQIFNKERLSLGCSKKADFTLVKRRLNLCEILPLWFVLGQMVPPFPYRSEGTYFLLDTLKKEIADRRILEIEPCLKHLFSAGFEGVLSPRTTDTDYQGFQLPKIVEGGTPLSLLSEGAEVIRSLFIQQRGEEIELLPCLPPAFHCGRFLDLSFPGGTLSLEWSKKQLRRCIIRANTDGEIVLTVPKGLKSARLGSSRVLFPFPLHFKAKEIIVLDRFER